MRDFLSPFDLKCFLPVAADHVVRRKLRMIDNVHRTRELYGRGTQFHLAAERNGVHSDKLMD
jgi:hypothetical protein